MAIASKLTSIVKILASFMLSGEHIFQVLAQYLTSIATILASIYQVNTPLVLLNLHFDNTIN